MRSDRTQERRIAEHQHQCWTNTLVIVGFFAGNKPVYGSLRYDSLYQPFPPLSRCGVRVGSHCRDWLPRWPTPRRSLRAISLWRLASASFPRFFLRGLFPVTILYHTPLYMSSIFCKLFNQAGIKQPPPVSQGRRYHGNFDFSPRTTARSFSLSHKWYISTITRRRRSVTASGTFSVSDSLTLPCLQAAY